MTTKRRGLGRNLDALLGSSKTSVDVTAPQIGDLPETVKSDLRKVPVDLIKRGRYQPRRDMKQEALDDLANSIRSQGVIQPIILRPVDAHNYEIIAGERRWRAAQLAGLGEIPAIVRDISDEDALAMALIENIQRENLNPIEEAGSLQRLIDEFVMTHQEVADAVGKSRTAVTNLLRLMNLNQEVKTFVEHGDLEMGHARALLALEGAQQSVAARMVVAKGLSVRETEKLVKRLLGPSAKKAKSKPPIDPDVLRLQQQLSDKLGASVVIQHGDKGKGRLVIEYNNLDELDGIIDHIN